jgi:hypothetical protein
MCMDPCSFKACSLLAVWMFVRGINSRWTTHGGRNVLVEGLR